MKEHLAFLWGGMVLGALISFGITRRTARLWLAGGALGALITERLGLKVREQIFLFLCYLFFLFLLWGIRKGQKRLRHKNLQNRFDKDP